ncbi:hypothetical protein CMI41_02595 [Candidatus Pacearchaeota archaeon]|jgi:hypothetical protein|nr:hypothetical protein [Candidatus Pacearchaeota archaeon]|tara:strand:- start:2319 stop:2591 length:273 start_codon:yes stop_codon:yes gene_type:complete
MSDEEVDREEPAVDCTVSCPYMGHNYISDGVTGDLCYVSGKFVGDSFGGPCCHSLTEDDLTSFSHDLLDTPHSISHGDGGYVSSGNAVCL